MRIVVLNRQGEPMCPPLYQWLDYIKNSWVADAIEHRQASQVVMMATVLHDEEEPDLDLQMKRKQRF